jgi:hypothetical protein
MPTGTSSLAAALYYAAKFGWFVFPCIWRPGPKRKQPLIKDQHGRASRDPQQITVWWTEWKEALIGVSAGRKSGVCVLDIDVKRPGEYGFDTLEELGHLPLPNTPMQHTASGGLHLLFAQGDEKIRSTTGKLGPGLDVRSDNNHFIAAVPGSGYSPDPHYNLETVPLAPAPSWLNPPLPKLTTPAKPVRPCEGLSRYADAAIERACQAIRHAPHGAQYPTLRDQSFSIGTLAGAGGIPAAFARAALIDAAAGMVSYDARDPWTQREIERVVNGCFAAGLANPRPVEAPRRARR